MENYDHQRDRSNRGADQILRVHDGIELAATTAYTRQPKKILPTFNLLYLGSFL